LHCRSNFSFGIGASDPEELVEEAVRLGLETLAVTDRNGFYGIVRFAEAARAHGLPTVFGAELVGEEMSGEVVLARNPQGYAQLARAVSLAQLNGEKGAPRYSRSALAEQAAGPAKDAWVTLTGSSMGTVPRALEEDGPAAARKELDALVEIFGRSNVMVELWDHGQPLDSARNDALARLAVSAGVGLVAANAVDYHTPSRRRLATALAAVARRASLDEANGWLSGGATAHIRSGREQNHWFARYPGVVEQAAELGRECAFDLSLVAPQLPPFPCPAGHDEMSWLRRIVETGATTKYGSRNAERMSGAWKQIDHELDTIETLNFPGYFLVVWDIVEFCRRADIYCQGRGSAANSAVCFALGVTKADAVALGLLFERFLSPERDGPPDIDIDIESGRREEVIQYVYERYGRHHAAQVCNVITYRARSSVRDMARSLGYAPGQQDAFAKNLDRWAGIPSGGRSVADAPARSGAVTPSGGRSVAGAPARSGAVTPSGGRSVAGAPARSGGSTGGGPDSASVASNGSRRESPPIPDDVLALAAELENSPRHIGIHSGGMVICDRPIIEVCPVEWARMKDRSVLQWDKDDCAATGLVKFDLLGLGMLTALHLAVDLIAGYHKVDVDLSEIPQEQGVYDMLCRADSIGVFQVESRAQMATLPRLRPRTFYDLVVEVALIRPGPIQGGSVHPYIRRRNGQEPVTYLHPLLKNALAKTLGIPLFQEQLMQMAIDVGGFSAADADQLRQAMGSKRSAERMERLRGRFYAGMAERGITGEVGDAIWEKLAAFANFGFPESHSVSFAYLVYSSAWIKHHYPAAFCASLLNAQPMGFYSPHSLVQDARRHGVRVDTPCINMSGAGAVLEGAALEGKALEGNALEGKENAPSMRLGLSSVRTIGDDEAEAVVAERAANGLFVDVADVRRRTDLNRAGMEALATAGAFDCFGVDRRQALWTAGAMAQSRPSQLPGIVTGIDAPQLPGMSDREMAQADLWATGVAAEGHPTRFIRNRLNDMGIVVAKDLLTHHGAITEGVKVAVAGVVTHRQRPATAGGTTFINLEDETGLINVVVSKGCWLRHRKVASSAAALIVRGRLERTLPPNGDATGASGGVVNVIAERIEPLTLPSRIKSRDFK